MDVTPSQKDDMTEPGGPCGTGFKSVFHRTLFTKTEHIPYGTEEYFYGQNKQMLELRKHFGDDQSTD